MSGVPKNGKLTMELVCSRAKEELRLLEHLRIDPRAHNYPESRPYSLLQKAMV